MRRWGDMLGGKGRLVPPADVADVTLVNWRPGERGEVGERGDVGDVGDVEMGVRKNVMSVASILGSSVYICPSSVQQLAPVRARARRGEGAAVLVLLLWWWWCSRKVHGERIKNKMGRSAE